MRRKKEGGKKWDSAPQFNLTSPEKEAGTSRARRKEGEKG